MIVLIKDKFERFVAGFLVFTSISFVSSLFIKLVLTRTDSKTNFISIFVILFSIFTIALILLTITAFFNSFKEIYTLSKKWNISINDIAEGIYTYEIENYYNLNAIQFLDELKKAKNFNKLNKNHSYG